MDIINSHGKKRQSNGRLPFTKEEDQKLLQVISNLTQKETLSKEFFQESINWKKISRKMGNRTARQCKERYFHYLSPQINNKKWTLEEDSLLLSKVSCIGKKWKVLEKLFNNRTEINIRNRYYILQRMKERISHVEQKRNKNLNKKQINLSMSQFNNFNNQDREEIKSMDENDDDDIEAFAVTNVETDCFEKIEEFFKDLSDITFDKYMMRGNRTNLLSFFNGHVYDICYLHKQA